jgi:hypothetical protein
VIIAGSIAQLSPPRSHGDRVALEVLEQQSRQVAQMEHHSRLHPLFVCCLLPFCSSPQALPIVYYGSAKMPSDT